MKLSVNERKLLGAIKCMSHAVNAANGFARDALAVGETEKAIGHLNDAREPLLKLHQAINKFDPEYIFKGGM